MSETHGLGTGDTRSMADAAPIDVVAIPSIADEPYWRGPLHRERWPVRGRG